MSNVTKSGFRVIQNLYGKWVELPIQMKSFAAGEVQVSIETDKILHQDTIIEAFIKDAQGIIILAQIRDILKCLPRNILIDLRLHYLPYSRYDRPMTGQYDARSLNVLTTMINNLDFNSVTIYDNHSDVGTALLQRCVNVPQEECIEPLSYARIIDMNKYDALVIPDAGAKKKVDAVARHFGITQTIQSEKKRDLQSNAVTDTKVYGDVTGLKLLIVDDICSGGRTFIQLGKLLKERGALSVDLYTTFGIYDYGVDVLIGTIDKAFCLFAWKEFVEGTDSTGILTYLNS